LPNPGVDAGRSGSSAGAVPNLAETTNREEKDMACDTDLSGTDLKVVQYSIVSVDPDLEHDGGRLLYGPAVITTTDDMRDCDFTAWVIALYLQTKDNDPLLKRRVDHEEKQYLRACYCVQCRMAIPDVNYQKTQANALRDINRTLKRIGHLNGDNGDNNGPHGSQGGGSSSHHSDSAIFRPGGGSSGQG
jgi:uncharacterized membrane protein YgcG